MFLDVVANLNKGHAIEELNSGLRLISEAVEVTGKGGKLTLEITLKPSDRGNTETIIAVDKKTGKLAWDDNSVGEKILHGQWSSPAVGTIGGVVQVVIGQGDGYVRGYEAKTGKKLWSTRLGDVPSAAPITYMVDGKQYVALVVGFGSLQSTGFIQLVPDIGTPARSGSAVYVFALP